jgi:uncharacterized protein (TIGR00369 family)
MTAPVPRPDPSLLARYAERFTQSRSLQYFGLKVRFPTPDRVEVALDEVRPEFRGGLGSEAVNGGVLAAMFDLVIGCTPALVDPTRRSATVQLSMSFERPVRGEQVVAEGWIDTAGTRTLFSSARILDANGQVCARCQGVVSISQHPWADGQSPAVN